MTRAETSNCHTLMLSLRTIGNFLIALMPASAHHLCILVTRDLGMLVFVSGLCRWSNYFRLNLFLSSLRLVGLIPIRYSIHTVLVFTDKTLHKNNVSRRTPLTFLDLDRSQESQEQESPLFTGCTRPAHQREEERFGPQHGLAGGHYITSAHFPGASLWLVCARFLAAFPRPCSFAQCCSAEQTSPSSATVITSRRVPRAPCVTLHFIDVSDSHSVASHPICPSRGRPVCGTTSPGWADQPTYVELLHIGNDRSTAAFDPSCTHNEYDTAARIHGRCSRTAPSVRPRRAYAGDVCQDAERRVVGALRVDSWPTARSWCDGPAIRKIPPAQLLDLPQRFMMARAASSLTRACAHSPSTAPRTLYARKMTCPVLPLLAAPSSSLLPTPVP
jgi:hypothetical protein